MIFCFYKIDILVATKETTFIPTISFSHFCATHLLLQTYLHLKKKLI